jgi:8-oxo-dGTP pyrophosphatase MutT (NUDIX family)
MRPSRPVRPRDAASLAILRGQGAATEVLLGRRAARHRFMPNVYVFPGGRLDRADLAATPSEPLRAEVEARLCARCRPEMARALAVAAVRETFEETGLAFGEVRQGRLSPALAALDYVARAITPPDSPIRYHARFFAARAEDARGELRDSEELSDLRWVRLEEALRLPLVDVTEFVVQEIARRVSGWTPPGAPLFHYRGGRACVRYE